MQIQGDSALVLVAFAYEGPFADLKITQLNSNCDGLLVGEAAR